MYTPSVAGRTSPIVAIVATLSGILAASVAGELSIEPAATAGPSRPAATGGLPVLPEVVVTATRLEA